MSDTGPTDDAIQRAKQAREQWKAQAAEHRRRPSYLRLTADELIALAENMKALSVAELEALDEAWHEMFGELLVLTDGTVPVARTSEPAQPTVPEPADDTIIHKPEVLRRTGMSKSQLYRMTRDGRFPAAMQLSERRVGWKVGDIKAWVEERPNQRVIRRRTR